MELLFMKQAEISTLRLLLSRNMVLRHGEPATITGIPIGLEKEKSVSEIPIRCTQKQPS